MSQKLPSVSFSYKSTHDWCRRQWKYVYLDRAAPDKPVYPATVLGTGCHAAINDMYVASVFTQQYLAEKWPVHFAAAMDKYQFKVTDAKRQEMLVTGADILKSFYTMAEREGILIPPLKTEWKFRITEGDFVLSGIIDLITVVRGEVTILDFKTGLHAFTQTEIDASDQLTFYALAAKVLLGYDQVRVGFFYPRLQSILYSQHIRTDADYEKLKTEVREILTKIQAKDFEPSYKKCNWCRFSGRCAGEDMAARTGLDSSWFYTEPHK